MTELIRNRYEPLEVVGEGGEGRLVKALDLQHDRFVALKLRAVATDADRDLMLGEARVLLAVPPHANLALVRDDFFEDGNYVIVMDWVDGVDLGRVLQTRGRPGLSPSSVVGWLAEAADALTHLHTRDPPVIHGDVKPASLVLTRGGHIVLVDFGVSTVSGSRAKRLGTPGFAAPELLTARPGPRVRRVRARRDGVHAAHRRASERHRRRRGTASTPSRQPPSRPRSEPGWRRARRAARRHPGSSSSACAPVGARLCRPVCSRSASRTSRAPQGRGNATLRPWRVRLCATIRSSPRPSSRTTAGS